MATASQARQLIGDTIKARPGGVYGFAGVSGVHFTRIYSFLRGGRLEEDNAGKLRVALPEINDAVWADAFAPPPADPEPVAGEAQA